VSQFCHTLALPTAILRYGFGILSKDFFLLSYAWMYRYTHQINTVFADFFCLLFKVWVGYSVEGFKDFCLLSYAWRQNLHVRVGCSVEGFKDFCLLLYV